MVEQPLHEEGKMEARSHPSSGPSKIEHGEVCVRCIVHVEGSGKNERLIASGIVGSWRYSEWHDDDSGNGPLPDPFWSR